MPKIIEKSISILSDAGLGMAMFSLGEWSPFLQIPIPTIISFLSSFAKTALLRGLQFLA